MYTSAVVSDRIYRSSLALLCIVLLVSCGTALLIGCYTQVPYDSSLDLIHHVTMEGVRSYILLFESLWHLAQGQTNATSPLTERRTYCSSSSKPLISSSIPYKVQKIEISKNTQKEDWVSPLLCTSTQTAFRFSL